MMRRIGRTLKTRRVIATKHRIGRGVVRQIQQTADGAYRYRYFGGFRLLLAVLVMIQHFAADLAPAPLAAALAPYAIGSMAVLAFFALSGFVITEAVDAVYRNRAGPFLTNRLLRIVPHFLLAVALSMAAHALFRHVGGEHLWRSQPSFPDPAFALPNMLLNFAGIVPGVDRFIDYNFLDITWAVRVEMAFYLGMAVCIAIGKLLPWRHGFAAVAGALLLLLLPLSWRAMHGFGPAMLVFVPYFAFGAGLYFATTGSRAGWLTVLVTVPVPLWHQAEHLAQAASTQNIPLSVTGNLLILAALLAGMTALGFARIRSGRETDRWLGNLTYPLYLYHEVVLIVVLTFSPVYAYTTLAAGILLSLLLAAGLMALVDPAMTRARDRVRGRALQMRPRPTAGPLRRTTAWRPVPR
jgi:peptidoglycan/LPS O-acetylase OafA/YrhL